VNLKAEGDYIIVEKVDYEEEQVSEGGIIFKQSQILDSSFVESKILSLGRGLPLMDGTVPPVDYSEGDTILYDARSRIGMHKDFDVIRREHIVAVIQDETE
jgi:co-chaperonin GroES (HSP10)